MKYNKIHHLSHNDLDGYGSQYITSYLRDTGIKIKYYNTNYINVLANINSIFSEIVEKHNKIKQFNQSIKNNPFEKEKSFDKILLLITDVSISEKEEKKINNFLKGNKHIDLTIQVLDHHKSGEKISSRNQWYKYNINKCGTSLTADFVISMLKNKKLQEYLLKVGSLIQSYDIWEEYSEYFPYANLLNDILFDIYFYELFENTKREFFFKYISNFMKIIKQKNLTIENIEQQTPLVLKDIIKYFIKNKKILKNKNIRSIHKLYYLNMELYKEMEKETNTLKYKKYSFKVLYNMNTSCFQQFAHFYLSENKNIDFLININQNGKSSLRSIKEGYIDLSDIANNISNKQGGGHALASGAKFDFKNNVHSYEEVTKELLKIKDIDYCELK